MTSIESPLFLVLLSLLSIRCAWLRPYSAWLLRSYFSWSSYSHSFDFSPSCSSSSSSSSISSACFWASFFFARLVVWYLVCLFCFYCVRFLFFVLCSYLCTPKKLTHDTCPVPLPLRLRLRSYSACLVFLLPILLLLPVLPFVFVFVFVLLAIFFFARCGVQLVCVFKKKLNACVSRWSLECAFLGCAFLWGGGGFFWRFFFHTEY